jgi:hypothetical protein
MGEASVFASLFVIFIGILITVLLTRWLFRIDTMVDNLKYQNALLIRLLKKQGATNQEIRDAINTAGNFKELLKD